MNNYISKTKIIFWFLILIILMSCSRQTNNSNKQQQIDSKNTIEGLQNNKFIEAQLVETEKTTKDINGKINFLNGEISIPGELFITNSLNFRKKISGSWSSFDKEPTTVRILSWGEVPVIDTEYLLIDLLANNPVIIIGGSEGGSGFDHQIARICGFLQDNYSCWLFYKVVDSGFQTINENIIEDVKKVLIHYDPNQDSIRIDPNIIFAGGLYSEDYIFNRVSSVIE